MGPARGAAPSHSSALYVVRRRKSKSQCCFLRRKTQRREGSVGDSNAGESLFITCPVPLTPSLGPASHLTLNKLHRPTLGPSLSCSNFPAASLTHLLPSGPSQAEPGIQQARSAPGPLHSCSLHPGFVSPNIHLTEPVLLARAQECHLLRGAFLPHHSSLCHRLDA